MIISTTHFLRLLAGETHSSYIHHPSAHHLLDLLAGIRPRDHPRCYFADPVTAGPWKNGQPPIRIQRQLSVSFRDLADRKLMPYPEPRTWTADFVREDLNEMFALALAREQSRRRSDADRLRALEIEVASMIPPSGLAGAFGEPAPAPLRKVRL